MVVEGRHFMHKNTQKHTLKKKTRRKINKATNPSTKCGNTTFNVEMQKRYKGFTKANEAHQQNKCAKLIELAKQLQT